MSDDTTFQANYWYAISGQEVVARLGTDADLGLTSSEVVRRQETYGVNAIASEPAPSVAAIAIKQLRDPMNLMLVGVSVVSFFINQTPVGILVGVLVFLNVVLGTRQEQKARAAVDALARLQTPRVRVTRDGTLLEVAATELVPGDIVSLEAGDLVPADGRILRSSTIETQEAALTGESAPIPKDAGALTGSEVPLGDRVNMVFQNTSVTRGTATMAVTETGMNTEMGQIASMLTAVPPTRSPLQRELDSLTKVLGIIAWAAVALIVGIGFFRDQPLDTVLLLGISMAVSAIPTGLPTFVQAMLAYGSKQLAEAKAVVKSLSDVETLGATSAINSDKTGTLTLNEMMVRTLYYWGDWFTVAGDGYDKTGAVRGVAGVETPNFTPLAYGLCLASDATVSDTGAVVGDPTEAALVVLAAKIGVDAESTRRTYPRFAEVPFDSEYKFMATFHHLPLAGRTRLVELVKGGPDVVLARCTRAYRPDGSVVPMNETLDEVLAANEEMSSKGLRVLAFAIRFLDGMEDSVGEDPMAHVQELVFVGMVGIIDPLRPEAIEAVRVAHDAGIEVRMITGDHTITAGAIGAELGLGAGAMSGTELAALSDEELTARMPDLHVFGRVTPQDKLRLARLMQESGDIVAMTGDAVNDAAALKQADVGVAMGSGSEVTKQAANMILTDDNFGTLVKAIRLGRSIYDKIVAYVRYQMTQLYSLILLFLVASIFNINDGIPLTPMMVLFLNFFVVAFPVLMIMLDPPGNDLMTRPPRDPKLTIANPDAIRQWLTYGLVLFAVTLAALQWGPGTMSSTAPSVPVTMAFVVMGLGSIFSGVAMRRDPASGLTEPIARALLLLAIPAVITVFAVETSFMQRFLMTTPLTGPQWLLCVGLAAIVPLVVEIDKALRRRRARRPPTELSVEDAVAPKRASQTV